jgi:hypothetical protein
VGQGGPYDSLAPLGNPFTNLIYQDFSIWLGIGGGFRPVIQTGAPSVQILQKLYLFHPNSDLDVPHMNLDILDETYPMVKSKLYFVDIDHTGQTSGTHRSDQTYQFWVRTCAPLFSGIACMLENIHKRSKLAEDD